MIALAHISALPAAIGAVLVLSTVSHGQAEVRRLTTPERTVDHGFTKITEAKELGNRSILILDKHENLVFHVDSAWSQATQVSRHGGGPTEYRIPLGVFVGPDGGALLKDRNGLKFLVLDDAGNVRGAYAAPGAAECETERGRYVLASSAMDSSGLLYAQADPALRSPGGVVQVADSAAIVRWRSPCARDTVAYVPNPFGDEAIVFRSSRVIRRMGRSAPAPFGTSVQWAVARDGRIAIVVPDPYHVDMVDVNGRRHSGRTIPVPALQVTDEHKVAWRAEQALPAPGLVIARNVPGASRQMLSRDVVEPEAWPDQLPPFLDNAVEFDMDGMLWVRRTTAARTPATYDVINSRGERAFSVVLPSDRRIVGFGDRTVLVAHTDEDGLEHLERYENPASPN